ncbi:DMT family transporter [Methyloligella solikamskensis]|uniref:DMT family transporter n=1 Tax=Methyloligella solikamskensis TaxID=1177756 RepID=A0ABW3J787_9HYPH
MTPASAAARFAGLGFVVALIAATFLMGSSFIAAKILLNDGFPPIVLVGWRFVVAALATLPIIAFEPAGFTPSLVPGTLGLRETALIMLIGLLQTTAVLGLLFLAMVSISASTAAILLFTNPIWVAMLSRIFLGEELHGKRIAGHVLGVVGVALAMGAKPGELFEADALLGEFTALASALCWSCATILTKRARLPVSAWTLSFWQMLFGAILLLLIAYALGQHWPDETTPAQWGWFLWLAIPASTGSFGLWFLALSKGGATRASSYLFLAPFFTVVLSALILDAHLSWIEGLGGLLIGVALWLVNREGPAAKSRARMDEALAEGEP